MYDMRKVKIVFNIFLGVIGIVTLLILAGHFGWLNTVKPYIVQSGSMSPSVPLGSVVLVRAASYYGQNDIITFRQNGNPKNLVTHRIVYKKSANVSSEPTYFTIGDTNDDIDRYEVKSSDIVGKVYFSIPFIGYAVDFAKTPKGFILLVIIPATIIIYEELRFLLQELRKVLKKIRKKKEEESIQQQTRHNLPKATVIVPVLGAALVLIAVTGSFFLDREKSSENIMGASSTFETSDQTLDSIFTATPSGQTQTSTNSAEVP